MAYNRSELFKSRTGIHGGVRRGTAAVAVGAVLVLATGVPASQGDEGDPQSGGNAAVASRDAPGQNRDGKETKEARQAPAPAALSVPAALLPAVSASLAPAVTAAPTTGSAALATPLPSIPLPTPSDVPLVPSAATPAVTVPVPSTEPPAPQLTGATAPAAPTPDTAAQGAPSSAVPGPSSEPGGQANGTAARAVGGSPSGVELPAGQGATGQAGPGDEPAAGAEVLVPAAVTQAAAAPQEAGGRAAQAAGVPQSAAQSVAAAVRPQPELEATVIGLGVGLVGLAATAGAVYFRMRKP
jgi:hypothetical protein